MSKTGQTIWQKRLVNSLHINRKHAQSKYYQVASVCPEGRPKNRTMVFRGFLSATQSLLSVTDLRSEKVGEWQFENNTHFEICWYFSDTREQYRLAGDVVLLSKSIERSNGNLQLDGKIKTDILNQQWSNLSITAQQAFYSENPKTPFDGKVRQDNEMAHCIESNNESDSSSNAQTNAAERKFEISENFCVVVFIPNSVDYLNLKSTPQNRCLYNINNDWKEENVSP